MKVIEYQKLGIPLESLSLQALRGVDIQTPEEEKVIQKLVNRKLSKAPVKVEIYRPGDKGINTDFKTKEEELAFQKIIDERVAQARPKVEPEKFCEFCDALGPIKHKANCTRPY